MLLLIAASLVAIFTLAINRYFGWAKKLDQESGLTALQCIAEASTLQTQADVVHLSKEASRSLSIVLPAYNEDGRIQSTLLEVLSYLEKRRNKEGPAFTYEVIVADDGSKDATTQIALGYARQYGGDAVRVVRLVRNKGKGYAVRCGVAHARGQVILFADADGATPVRDVEKLEAESKRLLAADAAPPSFVSSPAAVSAFNTMRQQGAAFVLGSRAHLEQQAIAKRTWFRNFLMHGFHFLVMLVVGSSIRDTQCGFKLVTRPAARLLFNNLRLQRWCFDVELIYLAEQYCMPLGEVGVTWTEIPGSKVKITGVALMALELVTVRLMYSIAQLWQIRSVLEER